MAETPQTEIETAAPKMREDGVALHGDYPLNHLLRTEALSKDGKAEDPDALVTADEIAEAGERIKAEEADAAERAKHQPSMQWTRDRLAEHAQGLGIPVEGDANKAAILADIEAAPGAGTEA